MPIASTAIIAGAAAAGLGLQIYGMTKQQQASDDAKMAAQGQAYGSQIQAMGSEVQARGSQVQVEGAVQQNAATKAITALEFQSEAQRNQAMELDAKRQQLEIIRNEQRARSMGLSAATAQGASKGSGLQGGYGQISGDTGTNLAGVQQNLEIGRNVFGINSQISGQRLAYAAGGDTINEGQGLIATGSGVIAKGAGVISQFGGQAQIAQANSQLGAGYMSLGGSIVGSGAALGKLGGGFPNPFAGSTLSGWSGGTYTFPNGSISGIY